MRKGLHGGTSAYLDVSLPRANATRSRLNETEPPSTIEAVDEERVEEPEFLAAILAERVAIRERFERIDARLEQANRLLSDINGSQVS